MTNGRRHLFWRGRPCFLTCLTMAITVVVILHQTYTNSGPGSSLLLNLSYVSRPSSVHSKMDILAPTKERPQTSLTQKPRFKIRTENYSSTTQINDAQAGSFEKNQTPTEVILSVIASDRSFPQAAEETHFRSFEPGSLPTADDSGSVNITPTIDTKNDENLDFGKHQITDETPGAIPPLPGPILTQVLKEKQMVFVPERVRIAEETVTNKTTTSRDINKSLNLDLNQNFSKLGIPHTSGTIITQVPGAKQVRAVGPDRLGISVDANVQQSMVETGLEEGLRNLQQGPDALERSRVNHDSRENLESASPVSSIKATVNTSSQEINQPESEQDTEQQASRPQPSQVLPTPKNSGVNSVVEELQACKKAIIDASSDLADPTLYGTLYKNVTAFSKSYELMEKVFKVYWYKDGRKPLVHSGPMLGIYASEGQFIERLRRVGGYLTNDPLKAHMFFLPYSVQHMVANLYVPNSHSMLPLSTFIKDYVDSLARRYPYWNRTQGADHFFVSCHDWISGCDGPRAYAELTASLNSHQILSCPLENFSDAQTFRELIHATKVWTPDVVYVHCCQGPATTREHPALRTNAVKVVCNSDLTEEFVLGKDASLPEVYLHSKNLQLKLGGPNHNKRPYLAFFAGQMHGRVRPILLDHWKDKDPDMKIYEVIPKPIAREFSYIQHMKTSKYCICAMGYEVNSPRIVEAIYYDCVPVVIADNFVLPFSDVLNWDAFSVTVRESEIPNLKTILKNIPYRRYRSMQLKLRHVRQHFVWHQKPEKYDVFTMIMHSIWTSRLNRLEQVVQSLSGF